MKEFENWYNNNYHAIHCYDSTFPSHFATREAWKAALEWVLKEYKFNRHQDDPAGNAIEDIWEELGLDD